MSHTSVASPPSRARRWNDFSLAKRADSLHAQLRSFATKSASIGGEPEQAFEQSFASLAYSYLKDQAPRLIDHLIGFQLVERNNDNTKAVGVFGFKIGDSWAYAPVFFLNGDLKGHELLYLKNQDMFVPLTESWVNYVSAKRPHVLGNPAKSDQGRQLGVRQPDVRSLSVPPMWGKRSSAGPEMYPNVPLAGWLPPADGFKYVYAALSDSNLEDAAYGLLSKVAGSSSDILIDFISRRPEWCKLAMDVCDAYPSIGESFRIFHGDQTFVDALTAMRQKLEKAAALTPEMEKTVYDYHFKNPPAARRRKPKLLGDKQSAGPAVEMVVKKDVLTSENGPDLASLSDDEAAAVARNGYLVRDHRTGDEVSVAYDVQVEMSLVNPDSSGLYELLQKPATFVKSLIIMQPHAPSGRKSFAVAIRLDPREWVNAPATSIFAKPYVGTQEDYNKWYEGLSDSESLETGGTYVVISRNGIGTVPLEIRESLGDGRYRVWARDYTSRDRPSYLPSLLSDRREHNYEYGRDSDSCVSGPEMLLLSDREGTSFRSSANSLQVPKDHKVLRLKSPPKPKQDEDACCMEPQSEPVPFQPGNIADLQMEIMQKTASLKIYADSCEVSVNGQPRTTKIAALRDLIVNHGFRTRDAEAMLKQAEKAHVRGSCGRFRVIYGDAYPLTKSAADPFLAGQGATAPAIQDPSYDYSQDFGGQAQVLGPDAYGETVEGLSASNTDPSVYDNSPENLPDPYTMQAAQQAGQAGQKEVFDTAMISGLLKNVRQDPMISRYTPDLLKAMDRCGRLLALLYWHNDQFADRFGKSDLPELEDSLRNTFDSTGELVLFLKARDVAPLAGGVESDVDVDQATGD